MGLLSEGRPLSWPETKEVSSHIRRHGIEQFIHQYIKLKDLRMDSLKWGDEIEYLVVKMDSKNRRSRLSLKAPALLRHLTECVNQTNEGDFPTDWRPEYANYMLEGTPRTPYGPFLAHFNIVEDNMKQRRKHIKRLLDEDETVVCLTAFPRLGCPGFTYPEHSTDPINGVSKSLFFPDGAINDSHPRFKDVNTPKPFLEDLTIYGDTDEGASAQSPDHIYMDCMGFGMGCACLQMTFQACNIQEARYLYDQLSVICPIMFALSAASPIFRGYLADTDCRWNIIAASVDDRTEQERGNKPLRPGEFLINKSRYDSIDSYLSDFGANYNDIELVKDMDAYNRLREAGIDHLLAQHISHLFIRDPISVFEEKIHQDDENDTDHFENIQSTNWQTMRFKPPPVNSGIGWRVEFRPTEVQLTDFENAAYAVFIVLLTRVILSFKLNFLIPISKVDDNLRRAQSRDAVKTEKFFFRKDPYNEEYKHACIWNQCPKSVTESNSQQANHSTENDTDAIATCSTTNASSALEEEYSLMSVDEIVNGTGDFPGLIPLINDYLNTVGGDIDTRCTIGQYLKLIQRRASGELLTTAAWIRKFVLNHPEYKQDSVVSDAICFDLINRCESIVSGEAKEPELVFDHSSKTADRIPKAVQRASESPVRGKGSNDNVVSSTKQQSQQPVEQNDVEMNIKLR